MIRLPRAAALALLAFLAASALGAAPARAQFNAFKDPVQGGSSSGAASGPDLKAVNDKIAAGQVTVGTASEVIATFINNGTAPVSITGVNLYPSSTVSASVTNNKCAAAPLPPEAQCAITIKVSGLLLGTWRVEVLVDHDGRTRLATATMSGQVQGSADRDANEGSADIVATPEELDFGNATGSTTLVRAVLLRNRTSASVAFKSIVLDMPGQAGFSIKPECPDALESGETCVVNVSWSPVTKGPAQAVLRVNHDAKSSVTKVDIRGEFAPAAIAAATIYPEAVPNMGILVSDMDKVDFGTGIDSVSAITMSLVNAGSVDLTLRSLRLAGSDNGLSVSRTGCKAGLVLKPVEACALTINWVPSRAGSVLDDLQILHSGARGVLILPIRGSATAAASRESIAVRQPGIDMQGTKGAKTAEEDLLGNIINESTAAPALTPVLDGYTVTSHSPTKAVVNGPIGSLVVRDGEDVVISGVRWTVSIVSTGVILGNDSDEILLVFDKSLRPRPATAASATTATTAAPAASGDDSSGTASTTTR